VNIIDKVRRLKKIVKTPINKSEADIKSIEEKIKECVDQLTKDAELREGWGMELGKLATSSVDEEDTTADTRFQDQHGGRGGGFRGRGRGMRNSGSFGRGGSGGGMSWGIPIRGGGYGGASAYGGSPGGFRRGGGGGGGYYNQPYGGGFNQFGGGGYQSFGGGGSWSGGQSYAGKRRADDSDRGGSWKRARGSGGRGGRGYY